MCIRDRFLLVGLNGAFLTGDIFNLFVFFEVMLIASYGLLLSGGRGLRMRLGLHYVVFNVTASTLFLIALGSGGIKPLVVSFCGDQFDQTNKDKAKLVFDAFYWIINFGSLFASLLIPLVLKNWGPQWAFGIPGILMFIATFVFWLGRTVSYTHLTLPTTF